MSGKSVRWALGAWFPFVVVACAPPTPAVVLAPDDATCRLVTDTTEQRVHPRYLSGPMPKYPRGLMMSGVQGQVVLEFELGCDGRVRPASVSVVSFTRKDFVEPATTATVKAKFAPALIEGRPVAVRIRQAVRFTIGPPQRVYRQ